MKKQNLFINLIFFFLFFYTSDIYLTSKTYKKAHSFHIGLTGHCKLHFGTCFHMISSLIQQNEHSFFALQSLVKTENIADSLLYSLKFLVIKK